MNRNRAASLALCAILAGAFGHAPQAAPDPTKRPEILVLHSYGADYAWTRAEQQGVEKALERLGDAYELRVEFMDSTRSPALVSSPLLRALYTERFSGSRFRLILGSDNAAYDFLRAYHHELFPGVPVVFMGVNGFEADQLRGLDEFTGVAEDPDFLGSFQAAIRLQPGTKRIAVPGDAADPTYRGNVALMRAALSQLPGEVTVDFHDCATLEACIEYLRSLPAGSAAVMSGNYRTAAGAGINNQRAVEISSSAVTVPLYSAWEFAVGHGAVGGSVLSGVEQGRLAGEIGIRILRGESPRTIPVLRNAGHVDLFDHRQMTRYGLSPQRLPRGAVVINAPERIYYLAPHVFWGGILAVVALALGVVTLAFNVRSRKLAQARLKGTNKQLADIIEFLPDATLIVGREGKVMAWNLAMERMTGVRKEDILGREHREAAAPFYGGPRPFLVDLLSVSDEETASRYSHMRRVDSNLYGEAFAPALHGGRGGHIAVTASNLFDGEGNVIGAIQSVRDISERKQAEEATRDANERFRSILRAATAYSIVVTDPRGVIKVFNEGAERMLGYRAEELVEKCTPITFHDPAEIAARAAELGVEPGFDVFVAGARRGEAETREWSYVRKDGSRLPASLTVTGMHAEDGALTGFIGIGRDLTSQKKLEQQLLQSQKMESIGLLAGGIAHDFNNLLTPILGYTALFLMDAPQGSWHEPVREVHAAAKRASELTRQLLAFSRKQTLELRTVHLGEVVQRFEGMLRRTIPEDVRMSVVVAPGPSAVRADPGQIEQVLMNLALNARDAMPAGGVLRIEVRNIDLDERSARQHPELKPGPCVMLRVSDTGIGMDPEVQRHLFEPFFTTKPKGRGTGLGLSTVYGIVNQHGGAVVVDSEPGKGSAFTVYLPRVMGSPAEPEIARERFLQPVPMRRGSETILVVEDDSAVRDLACGMLGRLGYRLLAAAGGESCLQLVAAHTGPIDLLLTDVVLPGMNGVDVARQVRARRSGIKVIYMSGYAADVMGPQGAAREESMDFIHKPLSLESLSDKVREVLDS